jgi:hypothetical protein
VRIFIIASVAAISLAATSALASNNGTFGPNQGPVYNPGGPQIQPYDCWTGFNKGSVNGSPSGQFYAWECKTPTVVCPPPPPGMTGGMTNQVAVVSGKGEVFKYDCNYSVPPK